MSCDLSAPQHPRVPVVRQHPKQEEQHEDAALVVHPVCSVSFWFCSTSGRFRGVLDSPGVSTASVGSTFFSSLSPVRYLDNKVFVSLASGEVIVYQREAGKPALSAQKEKLKKTYI